MKTYVRILIKGVALVLACAAVGWGLLTAAYCLPGERAAKGLKQSRALLEREGPDAQAARWCYSPMDNFTSCWMLHMAAYAGEGNPAKLALENRYRVAEGAEGVFDGLLRYDWSDPSAAYAEQSYGRYWNGYIVWLRPLMALMDYGQIRWLNLAYQLALTAAVLWAMVRKGERGLILPWLAVWAVLVPPALWRSLQYSGVYSVMAWASLAVLCAGKDSKRLWLIFELSGILTAFFDLLTYPLAALGVPLALLMALHRDRPLKARLTEMAAYSAMWLMGYAGMWASKWILATLATDADMISEALRQVAWRSSDVGTNGEHASVLMTWARNLGAVAMNPLALAAAAYGVFRAVRIIRARELERGQAIVFGVLALYPFVWYALTRNHSYMHCHFTSKALSISAMALLCMVSSPTKQKEIGKRKRM